MIILLLLFHFASFQSVCEDLLAPECPHCLICDNVGPVRLYVYYSIQQTFSIPSRVSQYTNITEIYIYKVVKQLPTELGLLTRLQTLVIESPLLIPGLPTELASLTLLNTLKLTDANCITNLTLEVLPLKHLKNLEITNGLAANNRAKISFPLEFLQFPLKKLILDGVNIVDTLPDLSKLNSLTLINLSNNRFFGPLTNLFPPGILSIDLSNNALSGSLPLFDSPLVFLDLGYNSFFGLIYPQLGNIRKVVLSNNFFSSLGIVPNTLEYLDVSYNALSDNMPYSTTLTYLDVSYNQYTFIPNQEYFYSTSGKVGFLNVAGNHIASAAILKALYRKILLTYPQDIDECTLETHACSNISTCTDGWYPRMSYTCTCNKGYRKIGKDCFDIDECQEANPCENKYSCINLPGSYFCCNAGFALADNTCMDVNECLPNVLKLFNNCQHVDACVNTNGSYRCCQEGYYNPNPEKLDAACLECVGNYTDSYYRKSPFEALDENILFDHQHCLGQCDDGQRILTSPIPSKGCNISAVLTLSCSFACLNLTEMTEPTSAISALYKEFLRGGFILDVYQKLYNFNVTLDVAFNEQYSFITIYNADNQSLNLIHNLTLQIVPNISLLQVQFINFTIVVSSTRQKTSLSNLDIIFIVIAPLCVLLMVIGYVLKKRKLNFKALPTDITWSYLLYYNIFSNWSYRGSGNSGFYYKDVAKNTPEYQKVLSYANFDSYSIDKVTLVFNETLLGNFVGAYTLLVERLDTQGQIFGRKRWTSDDVNGMRQWVYNQYELLCGKYKWNRNQAPIIPVCHGTDLLIAEKICETGFAVLSSLDSGWYGKGVYFTSFPDYCTSYIASRKNPCIILSWIVPGNIYPVSECAEEDLIGTALKSGYQSHYVITKADGKCAPKDYNGILYNEIVVSQESQIIPFALVSLNSCNLCELASNWAKQCGTP